MARRRGLSGIAITDHNTIIGGIETARHNSFDDLHVIVGAEIKTRVCEVIGLFLNDEIITTEPFEVLEEIRKQGGLSVLAHPFRSPLILYQAQKREAHFDLIKKIDAIEVFNSRTLPNCNKKALDLALKMNKPMIAGSDSHFYHEIGAVRTMLPPFKDEEELKELLTMGRTKIIARAYTPLTSIPFSVMSVIYDRARRISNLSF